MAGVNGNGDRANCGNSRFKSVLASTFYVYVTCREKSDFISAFSAQQGWGGGGGGWNANAKNNYVIIIFPPGLVDCQLIQLHNMQQTVYAC